MTSWFTQDFSTEYTALTDVNSFASLGAHSSDPYRSGLFALGPGGTGMLFPKSTKETEEGKLIVREA